MTMSAAAAIRASKVRKAFGATVALDDASFEVEPGQVHALLGENGAGKSTMVKLLSGFMRPDAGTLASFGQELHLNGPRDAHRAGIQTAFQELTQVPNLTVAENILLPYQPVNRFGMIRAREGAERVDAHLKDLGITNIEPYLEVGRLELPLRQKIEIARAIFRKPRILLLDEPTSALSGHDIDWLGGLIARLKREGVTILFISHRLLEVRAFCDSLTVLRNGKDVGSFAVSEISDERVIELIIGRSIVATFPEKPQAQPGAKPRVALRGLSAGRLRDASLELFPGEILGVVGMQGMGQLDLFRAMFGDLAPDAGQISVDGRPVELTSPRAAIDARLGISLVPEERKVEALALRLDGRRNVSLPVLDRFLKHGLIDTEAEMQGVAAALARVQVDQRALFQPVSAFSGGNQQKIVLAKWFLAGSRVLLLYDPTRGVDVGTKHEIYMLMADYAKSGGAVLFYSTELAEVINLSRRVLIVYAGRIVAELSEERGQINEATIMRLALGESTAVLGLLNAGGTAA